MHKGCIIIFVFFFGIYLVFIFLLQLLCISLVSLIFRYSAQKCLILPAECSPQKPLILLENSACRILFIQAYFRHA